MILSTFAIGLHLATVAKFRRDTSRLPPLPGPVLQVIFEHLSITDRQQCRLVCKLWNRVLIYYNLLPGVADYYIHGGHLQLLDQKVVEIEASSTSSPWSPLLSILNSIHKPHLKPTPPPVPTTLQRLSSSCLDDSSLYFLRRNLHIKLVAFEELPDYGPFLGPTFQNIVQNVTRLELESADQSKFLDMELQDYRILIDTYLPNLRRLSCPFKLLVNLSESGEECLKTLRYLRIQLPDVSLMIKNSEEYFYGFVKVATLLDQLWELKTLEVFCDSLTTPPEKRALSPTEFVELFKGVASLVENLGNRFEQYAQIYLMQSKSPFDLEYLTLSIPGFPSSALDNSGVMSLFKTYLGNFGQFLTLKLSTSILTPNLIELVTFLDYAGCGTELDLDFYLNGMEGMAGLQQSQVILSDPLIHEIVRSVTVTTLPSFSYNCNSIIFFHAIFPLQRRSLEDPGAAVFEELTTLKIHFVEPTQAAILFRFFEQNWPELRNVSIIVGERVNYQNQENIDRFMDWCSSGGKFPKEEYIKNTELNNLMHLAQLLKHFPKLETFRFWADLRMSGDAFFKPSMPGLAEALEATFALVCCVPIQEGLRKLSLRGLGHNFSNKCLEAFYGLPNLTHLELLGHHKIKNWGKRILMRKTPSLREVNFKF